MYKKAIYILLILSFVLITTACHRPNTTILFNTKPITKENLLSNASSFVPGQRIYYIFISEKKLEVKYLRVRVLKRDEKANNEPINLVYSKDYRLNKDQVYYYTNYIVMNEAAEYTMVIYDKENPERPLAVAEFRVK